MFASIVIPLMIAGGFDGVEPQGTCEIVARDGRVVGVREVARLTGYSPAHICYLRHGRRTSARFERKMRELGLKFQEGK